MFNNKFPQPFRPGLADKVMFREILDADIANNICQWNPESYVVPSTVGLNLMINAYWPKYGEYFEGKIIPDLF